MKYKYILKLSAIVLFVAFLAGCGAGSSSNNKKNVDTSDFSVVDAPYYFAEVAPRPIFLGDQANLGQFSEWVERTTAYPPELQLADYRASIVIEFVVSKHGKLVDVYSVGFNPVSPGVEDYSEEQISAFNTLLLDAVKSAIAKSGEWTAAKDGGKKVNFKCVIPLFVR